MQTLPEAFATTLARMGDAPAILEPSGGSMSFAELDRRSDALAARLAARGMKRGARVLVAMPVAAELYVALAGLWKCGLVAVFPEPAFGLRGLLHARRATEPQAFLATGAFRLLRLLPQLWSLPHLGATADPARPPKVAIRPEDPALISFTSGSTGSPKAIERKHGFLMAQHAAIAPLLAMPDSRRDLVAFPVFVLVNLAAGRCSVLPNWKLARQADADPSAICRWIRESGAERLLIPPSICEKLAGAGVPEGVKAIFTGGGPVFPDVLRRIRDAHSDIRIVAVYGSTEAEPIAEIDAADISDADWAEMAAGGGLLAGRPVEGLELRLSAGEIQVAGAHVNSGYMDPAQDAANKLHEAGRIWHRTGDAGRLDADGRLWLLGRWDAGGADGVMPFQIETAARFWPGVRRAALATRKGRKVLAVEGDVSRRDAWLMEAGRFGIDDVVAMGSIPMDRRHASKVDRTRLEKELRRGR